IDSVLKPISTFCWSIRLPVTGYFRPRTLSRQSAMTVATSSRMAIPAIGGCMNCPSGGPSWRAFWLASYGAWRSKTFDAFSGLGGPERDTPRYRRCSHKRTPGDGIVAFEVTSSKVARFQTAESAGVPDAPGVEIGFWG